MDWGWRARWATWPSEVTENGQTFEVEERLPQKTWLATEMEAAIRASGVFELVHRYGAMNATTPLR